MAPAGADRMTANTAVVSTTKPYLSYSITYAGVILPLALVVYVMAITV